MNKTEHDQFLIELNNLAPAVRAQFLVLANSVEAEATKLRAENGALWSACNKIIANTSTFASAQAVVSKLRDELAKI